MTDSLHIVCPHCAGVNRLPAARLQAAPRCGACHGAIFSGAPLAVNGVSLQKHITRNDIPVLVDFWAPWCGPCKMFAPIFQQAAARLEPRLRLLKLDTDSEQAAAAAYGIRSIPTLALFRSGGEQARIAGAMDLANLVSWVEQHL